MKEIKIDKRAVIPWLISIGIFLLVVLIWVVLGSRGVEKIEHYLEKNTETRPPVSSLQARIVAQQEFFSGSAVRIKPAVVSVCIGGTAPSIQPGGSPLEGIGSGVIVSPTGFIITSSRNISKGNIKVVNFEQTHFEGAALEQGHHHIYDAAIVSVFPAAGLAILKIDGQGLPAARLGDSNSLQMGDWCLAIGNPFGQKPVVASGIISSVNHTRKIDGITYPHLIEISCKGNQGFIGGPVINQWGEVVGIIIDKGYAVPSNQVWLVLNGLGIKAQ